MDSIPSTKKHSWFSLILALIIVVILSLVTAVLINWIYHFLGDRLIVFKDYISGFVNSTEQVIVVAMITGTVSIIGVVISSIVAKVVEYRYNVKRYLYDKKEVAYKQFIEMVYTIMENSKKDSSQRMTDAEMTKMNIELSKGLTLWGSNRVVKKWLEFRKTAINTKESTNNTEILFRIEDIIFEIRKDIGLGRGLKKGEILSMFINDIGIINQRD